MPGASGPAPTLGPFQRLLSGATTDQLRVPAPPGRLPWLRRLPTIAGVRRLLAPGGAVAELGGARTGLMLGTLGAFGLSSMVVAVLLLGFPTGWSPFVAGRPTAPSAPPAPAHRPPSGVSPPGPARSADGSSGGGRPGDASGPDTTGPGDAGAAGSGPGDTGADGVVPDGVGPGELGLHDMRPGDSWGSAGWDDVRRSDSGRREGARFPGPERMRDQFGDHGGPWPPDARQPPGPGSAPPARSGPAWSFRPPAYRQDDPAWAAPGGRFGQGGQFGGRGPGRADPGASDRSGDRVPARSEGRGSSGSGAGGSDADGAGSGGYGSGGSDGGGGRSGGHDSGGSDGGGRGAGGSDGGGGRASGHGSGGHGSGGHGSGGHGSGGSARG